MKKIPIYLISILTVFIFIMAFYIMVFGSIAISNNQLVNIFGYSYSIVPTGSMAGDREDSIQEGDVIIIKLSKYENANVEDIIHFYSVDNGFFITHRAINITEAGIITQGDAVPEPDTEIVTPEMYRGIVISSFSFFNIGNLLSYRNLIFLVIILIILFVLIREVVKIIITLRKAQIEQYEKRLEAEKKQMIDIEMERIKAELKKQQENIESKD
jgi:hypothetical protein